MNIRIVTIAGLVLTVASAVSATVIRNDATSFEAHTASAAANQEMDAEELLAALQATIAGSDSVPRARPL